MRTLLIAVLMTTVGCGMSTEEIKQDQPAPAVQVDPLIPKHIIPGNTCDSFCGMHVEGFVNTCEDFQKVEDAIIEAYLTVNFSLNAPTEYATKDETQLCEGLKGIRIYVRPDISLNGIVGDGAVYGQAFSEYGVIHLTEGSWLRLVVPHEVGHVLDYRFTPKLALQGDGHVDWDVRRFPVKASSWSFQVYGIRLGQYGYVQL